MKHFLLSLFLILILKNCSFTLKLSKEDFSLQKYIDKAFSRTNMLESGDEGFLVNIDFSNIYRDRVNFKNQYYYYYTPGNQMKNFNELSYQVNVGENKRGLARLRLSYHIPAVMPRSYIQYYYQWMYLYLYFDDVLINQTFHYTWEYWWNNYSNMDITGTVFNVSPGSHTISLKFQVNYDLLVSYWYSSGQFAYPTLDLEGEYYDNPNVAIDDDNDYKFILPKNQFSLTKRQSKFILTIDDYIVNIVSNGQYHNLWYYNGDNHVWATTKTIPTLINANDNVWLQIYDYGGDRGLRGAVSYYNSQGFPEMLLTKWNDVWTCDGVPASGAGSQVKMGNYENQNNWKPNNYNSEFIWGNQAGGYSACSAKLPERVRKSVIYATMCSHLDEVKVNNVSLPIPGIADRCETVKVFNADTTGVNLRSGDVLSFKGKKVFDNQNKSHQAYINNPHYSNFAAGTVQINTLQAVIAYQGLNNEVMIISTADVSLWKCNDSVPQEILPGSYRNDLYLNTAFGASSLYVPGSSAITCLITLP